VQQITTSISGSLLGSETMKLIERREEEMQLPRGEILSRGWRKFEQMKPKDSEHASRLVRLICSQVAAEYIRDQERAQRLVTLARQIDPPADNRALDEAVVERFDVLLGTESPLNEKDKELLRVILTDPTKFMHPHGQPQLSALARRFGVNPTTTRARWRRIRRKVAALSSAFPRTSTPPALEMSF
jgi:hypothetical protein